MQMNQHGMEMGMPNMGMQQFNPQMEQGLYSQFDPMGMGQMQFEPEQ